MEFQEIDNALNEILNSNTFLKSEHSKQLLKYLTRATLEKQIIKEYTIANEIFNKESDSGVRAYVLNLRRKLDEYYEKEGADSDLILTIPKGQYYIKFIKREKRVDKSVKVTLSRILKSKYFYIITGCIVVSLIVLIFLYQRHFKIENSLVWNGILNSKEPVLLVMGDNYFYGSKVLTGGRGVMRDFFINSDAEFDSVLLSNPGLKDSAYKINWSYMTKQVGFFLFEILPYFKTTNNRLTVSSEITYDEIRQNNILYFGKYNTIGILKNFVNNYYNITRNPAEISFYLEDTVIKRSLFIDNFRKEDYTIVLKFKTPYQKIIMFFLSADDPGNNATLNYFLKYKNLEVFESTLKLSRKENFFSAFFKVNAFNRTDFSIEFISGEKLKK